MKISSEFLLFLLFPRENQTTSQDFKILSSSSRVVNPSPWLDVQQVDNSRRQFLFRPFHVLPQVHSQETWRPQNEMIKMNFQFNLPNVVLFSLEFMILFPVIFWIFKPDSSSFPSLEHPT